MTDRVEKRRGRTQGKGRGESERRKTGRVESG